MTRTVRVISLTVILASGVLAQPNANKGQIVGTVYDPKRAEVAGAAVEVKNTGTGFTRQLTTNSRGGYRGILLDPGIYEVKAGTAGFATTTVSGIEVTVGSNFVLDIALHVEATSISLESGSTSVNFALPAPTSTLNANAILNLPINGRRFHDFAVLTPTVQVDPSRGQLSFAGQRGINSNIMLDGADYNQPFLGGIRGGERSNVVITVPQSAVQEFQVLTTGYSAEYGRSSGGVLNTITRSGANQTHGEMFYQLRHKELGARDPVQNMASLETLQQFGGAAGGPVKRERLFFFGAVEFQRSRTPRQVLFAQLLNRTPNAATQEAFSFLKSLERPFKQTNNGVAVTGRADYHTAAGNRLTLRHNASDANAENAVSAGSALDPFTNRAFSNDGSEGDRTHTGTVQYTHLFSPSVLNDLRFTGTYEARPRVSNSNSPQVDIRTIGYFGARNFLPSSQNDKRWQLSDSLSVTRGAHTVKLGLDFNHVTAGQVFGANQYGAFTVSSSNVEQLLDSLGTGGSMPNRFDGPLATYSRQIGNLTAKMSMQQVAAFAQDSWRLAPTLSLDYGIRWEGQFNPKSDATNQNLANLVRGFTFPNGQTIDPATIRDSPAQFMPRLGFAWTPAIGKRQTVVRGHTGIFYASTPLIVMAGATNNFRNPPGDVSITLAPVNGQTVYQQLLAVGVDLNRYPLDALPIIPVDTVVRAAQLALGGAASPFSGASLIGMASDFQNPRAFQAGLGADRELFRGFVAGAQLNYVNTVHLERNRDYNLPLPSLVPGDASQRPNYGLRTRNVRRPISTLNSVTARESSARSMFRSATITAQYRNKWLQWGSNYTYSENFSDDDNERDLTILSYADPLNLAADYGYSRLDMRHQVNVYFIMNLPLGFDVAASFRARDGLPINPVTGMDNNEEFSVNERPYTESGVSLARNSFRNRATFGNDLRVLKNFVISEHKRLQLSVEFFNVANVDNVVYSGVNGSSLTGGVYGPGLQSNGQVAVVDPRFMRLNLADGSYDRTNVQQGTPLQVQIGLRFYF